MMRFCSLGSGSGGNSTLIETTRGGRVSRVLIDCGFSLRELERRLGLRGVALSDIDAVFVTHEHGDHVGCAASLQRRCGTPLWASAGTQAAARSLRALPVQVARADQAIVVYGLELTPIAVPHDATEPLQMRCSDGVASVGVLTDFGSIELGLTERLTGCHALLVDSNHDPDLLETGPYPWPLKRRIAGPHGHLSNAQAADLVRASHHTGLRHVVAAHLSEQNNRPELARMVLAAALGTTATDIVVATADSGSPWLDLG